MEVIALLDRHMRISGHRILGEEVAFLDLDAKQGVFSKLKDLFKKN